MAACGTLPNEQAICRQVADEELGWTRRGREPYWTRSVTDSSS
jgi:hypothetical protein